MKTVLILGANSDVAKEAMALYLQQGFRVIAASRNLKALEEFIAARVLPVERISLCAFDATAFATHPAFYAALPFKPHIVLYAAGFQVTNDEALVDWEATRRMMETHYAGAVSLLNLVATDRDNAHLERIIGLSSLSGVRGRRSNFIYGSTKAAFTTYLSGLRQWLSPRHVIVNAVVAGYIHSKMTAHLDLPASLLMEPSFIAGKVVGAGRRFVIVPGFKWKIIYLILRVMPEGLVARLP